MSSAGSDTSGTVLVTGAARRLGVALLRELREHGLPGGRPVGRIVAVDVLDPRAQDLIDGVETARVDLRAPAIATLIAKLRPETVLHLDVLAAPGQAGGRTAMKERNVIGTMQLLAACQKADSVRRLVIKSSAAVYGCAPRDPALFTESTEPHRPPRSGYGKDVSEVEEYARGFARRRPDVAVTVLRFANFLGPGVDTAFADYLSLPVLPTVLGFDPRLQFVHIDDVVQAVRTAADDTLPGTYNVAGPGALTLAQVARRLGRPTVPVPRFATAGLGQALRRAGLADFPPDQLDLLTYGRVLDTERMTGRLGFTPRYSTALAVQAHAKAARIRPLVPPALIEGLERRITDTLARYGEAAAARGYRGDARAVYRHQGDAGTGHE